MRTLHRNIMETLLVAASGIAMLACAPHPGNAGPSPEETPALTEAPQETGPAVEPASAEDILREVRAPGAGAVLVNIWATWCMPCREEFPDLVRMRRDYGDQGFRLILVSADFDSEMQEVLRFLNEQGVDFRTYIKTGKDMEFINSLHEDWTGALPATFIYDGEGRLKHFWQEKANYATFEQRVLEVLNKPAGTRG